MNRRSATVSGQRGSPAGRKSCGFSLIELMVSITIGLLIVVALMALFINVSRSNRELAKTNIQIENGRFAIQILQESVMHAGYWGVFVPDFDDLTTVAAPVDTPTAIPDPCLNFDPAVWTPEHIRNLIGIPIHSGDTIPGTCAAVVTDRKAGTDILVVRHADTCVAGQPLSIDTATNCPNDAASVYFQSSLLPTPLVPSCTGEARYVLGLQASATLRMRDCVAIAPMRRFVSSIYYIRDFSQTAGDGIPALVRASFAGTAHLAPQVLIEGIEEFVVELGIDDTSITGAAVQLDQPINWFQPDPAIENRDTPTNRGTGIADRFVRCSTSTPCTAADLSNAVAAKIYVLARNLEATAGYTDTKTYSLGPVTLGPFNDRFPRHVYSSMVRIQNVSGRRQLP